MKKIKKIKIKLNGKTKIVNNNFIIHPSLIYDEKYKKNKN